MIERVARVNDRSCCRARGAIEFLTKPFRDQDLLDAIQVGLAEDRAWLERESLWPTCAPGSRP